MLTRTPPYGVGVSGHGHHHGHGAGHGGGEVHLGTADWEAMAENLEREGALLLGFLTDAVTWAQELLGPDGPPVRRVLDIGSGPGIGTCELARLLPDAEVVAVDGSQALLDRTRQRAAAHGVAGRVGTHLAELPGGLDDVEPAEVIWASMSLHHVTDEVAMLRRLRDLLVPAGVLVIAEFAEPTRVLPDDLDVGRPGLAGRLQAAGAAWFAALRAGLGADLSADLPSQLTEAGFDVLGSKRLRLDFGPPLSGDALQVALAQLRRGRAQLADRLDEDDLRAIDVLLDPDDHRGATQRPDLFLAASRDIHIARRPAQP